MSLFGSQSDISLSFPPEIDDEWSIPFNQDDQDSYDHFDDHQFQLYNLNNNSTIGNETADFEFIPQEYNWWGLLTLIIPLLALSGNLLVILAVRSEPRLQTRTNGFLVSLAAADLLVALLVMPAGTLYTVTGFWVLGAGPCLAWVSLDVLLCTASILHLATLSVDRFLALRFPWRFGRHRSRTRLYFTIAFVWASASAISLPLCLKYAQAQESVLVDGHCVVPDPSYRLWASIVCFYVPLLAMLITYSLTVHLLHSSSVHQEQRHLSIPLKLKRRGPKEEPSSTSTTTTGLSVNRSSGGGVGVCSQSSFKARQKQIRVEIENESSCSFSCELCEVNKSPPSGPDRNAHIRFDIDDESHLGTTCGTSSSGEISAPGSFRSQIRRNRSSASSAGGRSRNGARKSTKLDVKGQQHDENEMRSHHHHHHQEHHDPDHDAEESPSPPAGPNHLEVIQQRQHPPPQSIGSLGNKSRHKGETLSFDYQIPSSPRTNYLNNVNDNHMSRASWKILARLSKNGPGRRTLRSERKATKVLGVVFFAFVGLWLPFFALNVTAALWPGKPEEFPWWLQDQVITFATWLGWVSSLINPFVYTTFNRDFREAFSRLLRCKCRKQPPARI